MMGRNVKLVESKHMPILESLVGEMSFEGGK